MGCLDGRHRKMVGFCFYRMSTSNRFCHFPRQRHTGFFEQFQVSFSNLHDGYSLFDGFNWYINSHFITHVGHVLAHIEIAAFNHCAGIDTASLFFGHGVGHA